MLVPLWPSRSLLHSIAPWPPSVHQGERPSRPDGASIRPSSVAAPGARCRSGFKFPSAAERRVGGAGAWRQATTRAGHPVVLPSPGASDNCRIRLAGSAQSTPKRPIETSSKRYRPMARADLLLRCNRCTAPSLSSPSPPILPPHSARPVALPDSIAIGSGSSSLLRHTHANRRTDHPAAVDDRDALG